jgi:hypothetical protein
MFSAAFIGCFSELSLLMCFGILQIFRFLVSCSIEKLVDAVKHPVLVGKGLDFWLLFGIEARPDHMAES